MSLITISQSMGCDGQEIASMVAKGMDLELYNDGRLQEEAARMGIQVEELKSLDEKAPGFLDSLWLFDPQRYHYLMESVVYEVAKRGTGVIIGHGSQFLLREFGCAMHVLLHASDSYRIKNIMNQRGLDHKAAEKLIHKSDHERRGFMKFAFHMNWNDISLYDLVINPEKLGKVGTSHLIIEAGRSPQMQECSLGALDAMDRLSLAKRVESQLIRNNFSLARFYVEVPEKGHVHISGISTGKDDKKRLVDIITKVSGVSKVDVAIGVMPGI